MSTDLSLYSISFDGQGQDQTYIVAESILTVLRTVEDDHEAISIRRLGDAPRTVQGVRAAQSERVTPP